MAPGTLAAEVMPIDDVWQWYEDQKAANQQYRRLLFDALKNGGTVDRRFEFYNSTMLDEHFKWQSFELDHLTCFALISAAEGQIQADFSDKTQQKDRTPLGREFRDLKSLVLKRKEQRVRLEEDLIEAWKGVFPQHRSVFSDFVGALKYRHWLAHGRHWNAKVGRRYTPEGTYEIVRKVAQVVLSP